MSRILFLGFMADDDYLARVFAQEQAPQVSAVKFQKPLLQGLGEVAEVSLLAAVPIAPFPRNRTCLIGHHAWPLSAGVKGWRMPCLNLPGARLLSRLLTTLTYSVVTLCRSRHDAVLVYSLHSPFLLAARVLKLCFRLKLFVFIPDLPMHMRGVRMGSLRAALKRIDAALLRILVRGADGCFPITRAIGADWLPQSMPQVIIEGVAPQAQVMAPVLPSAGKRPRILYAGAFMQIAQFVTLFSATAELDAELVLVGSGEDKAVIEALAAKDARITVKEFMLGDALEQEFAAADYLLNPRDGHWEGAQYSFPSKLFDYMARGKPILSTRLPGVPDVYYGCFFEIPDSDPALFAQGMHAALHASPEELNTRIRAGFALLQARSPQAVAALVLGQVGC